MLAQSFRKKDVETLIMTHDFLQILKNLSALKYALMSLYLFEIIYYKIQLQSFQILVMSLCKVNENIDFGKLSSVKVFVILFLCVMCVSEACYS